MEPAPLPGVDPLALVQAAEHHPAQRQRADEVPRPRDVRRTLSRSAARKYAGSPMPWEAMSRMSQEDLGALYEYLHTLEPSGQPSPEEPTVKQ